MKLILSTSNIISSGQSLVRRPNVFSKSNVELLNSLRSNIAAHQHHITQSQATTSFPPWTTHEPASDTLWIPAHRPSHLAEPRESYEITVKLFYLPSIPSSRRCKHIREAIGLVLKELGVDTIDLLIVSYPGVTFDADDDGEEEYLTPDEDGSADESQGLDAQVETWRVLETLHEQGTIHQLGVSEFSSDRLEKLLPEIKIRPTVDQINVKDCCVVPKTLIMYAKEHNIELLTHNDCTDILPSGVTRDLLGSGEGGAGILASKSDAGSEENVLRGDVEPQWVIKYTAVVKNRGVVENKGYFASAQLGSCIEDKPKNST